jgi:hypothetical protein
VCLLGAVGGPRVIRGTPIHAPNHMHVKAVLTNLKVTALGQTRHRRTAHRAHRAYPASAQSAIRFRLCSSLSFQALFYTHTVYTLSNVRA